MGSKTGARYIGYGLVLLGVLLLLFVFYIGYLLYSDVISGSISSSLSSYNSNTGAAVGPLASLLQSIGVNGFLMLIIAILVLLILASIAGRIVKYGMNMLSLASEETEEEETEEEQTKEKENKAEEKRKK